MLPMFQNLLLFQKSQPSNDHYTFGTYCYMDQTRVCYCCCVCYRCLSISLELCILGRERVGFIHIGPVSDRCQTSVMPDAQSMSQCEQS